MKTTRSITVGSMVAMLAVAGVTASAQWRSDDASVPRIVLTDLQKLMAQGDVLIIDVRDVREFQVGHIPGAVSIPLGSETNRIAQLRKVTKQIVTYCT